MNKFSNKSKNKINKDRKVLKRITKVKIMKILCIFLHFFKRFLPTLLLLNLNQTP